MITEELTRAKGLIGCLMTADGMEHCMVQDTLQIADAWRAV